MHINTFRCRAPYPALTHIRGSASSRTQAVTTAIRSGLATAPTAEGATAEGKGGEEDEIQGEAAAKRAALLKRYGDRTPPSGPIAVKVDPAKAKTANTSRGGFDVEKAAASEVNHNEIWGDCECAAQLSCA